jgi:fumarylacetoacetate (FAA) hydrolase
MCEAGPEMTFHFGQLIAHICKTRNVRAGSIVGSGTVSNKDWSHGYSCIAEKRAIEDGTIMKFGRQAKGKDGLSVFMTSSATRSGSR